MLTKKISEYCVMFISDYFVLHLNRRQLFLVNFSQLNGFKLNKKKNHKRDKPDHDSDNNKIIIIIEKKNHLVN